MVTCASVISIAMLLLLAHNFQAEIWTDAEYEEEKYPFLREYFKKKPASDKRVDSYLEGKNAKLIPIFHSSSPTPCSCGMESRLLDLGHLFYPRYLHTAVCKSEGCGGIYKCTERHYKVRVLKQRDSSSTDNDNFNSVPETLKDFWQSEYVTVTVACECSL